MSVREEDLKTRVLESLLMNEQLHLPSEPFHFPGIGGCKWKT